jgi:nitrous oxidase accessory protein
MNKTVPISFAIFYLLFAISLMGSFNSVKASPDIIHVPADYAKIQWAIGNATDGDTIIVNAGICYENITLNKSLTLQGENKNSIIDGNGTGHVVTICADNVSISGFTIRNSGPDFWDSAVYVYNSSWCNISYNILIHNGHGIWLDNYSNNNIVTGNNASYNLVGIGISMSSNNIVASNYVFSSNYCGIGVSSASSNIIANNTASNNENGVWLDYSSNVTIIGNTASNNENGVWLDYSSNVTIIGNTASNNVYGIHLGHSDNNTIFHNNIINNTNQAQIINSTSIWDTGFEGNYWSNYDGLDADQDGIGDSPYIIDENRTDNYPLINPVDINTIPEFPSWTILPLLLVATLLTIICKHRLTKHHA